MIWSILLTPVFGGILHAANSRVLGQKERFWALTSAGPPRVGFFSALNFAKVYLGDFILVEAYSRLCEVILLLSWALHGCSSACGVRQGALRGRVRKSAGGVPLFFGLAALAGMPSGARC